MKTNFYLIVVFIIATTFISLQKATIQALEDRIAKLEALINKNSAENNS